MPNSGTSPINAVLPIKVARSTTAPSQAAPLQFENQTLLRRLELAIASSSSLNQLLSQVNRLIGEQSECLALWIAARDEQGQFADFQPLSEESSAAVWDLAREVVPLLIGHLLQSSQICSTPLPCSSLVQLVAAPLRSQSKPDTPIDFVLLGCFESSNQTTLRLQWLMGLATQAITNWFQAQTLTHVETKQRGLSDSLKLIRDLDRTTRRTQAAILIVNQLRRLLSVEQVALTLNGQLIAVSDVEQIDQFNESNKLIQAACNQTLRTGEPVAFLNSTEHVTPAQLALADYCRAHRIEACLNLPLSQSVGGTNQATPETIGGLLIAGSAERLGNRSFVEYLVQLTGLIGGHLAIVLRANRSIGEIAVEKIQSLRKHRWRKVALLAASIVAIALSMPVPYRIACDCEIQPVLRRFVAAPYDGILERGLVKNGEIVAKNQLLAQLDGRNLRIELAGLQAELGGAKKRRDAALAGGDIAQSQIARSETERLEAKVSLLEQRTLNLEVRSPIDGIIVSGDLEKVEGAPLEMGQTLFEVAPAEQMVAEIAIPETEIQYAKSNMLVKLKLNAFPFRTWSGKIASIHPSAEVVDSESVFVAQVIIDNSENLLRPGMEGSAKVDSEWSPLGWNLFHRSWESVRYWTIW